MFVQAYPHLVYTFSNIAFGIRDFVRFFDESTCVASESQMESKNKKMKNLNWVFSNSNYLKNTLRASHEQTCAGIITTGMLKHTAWAMTDKNYHFDAKQISAEYMKLNKNVKKYVFMILNAPKIVIAKYEQEMDKALAGNGSVREAVDRLGGGMRNDSEKMRELGNQLSEDAVMLNEDDDDEESGGEESSDDWNMNSRNVNIRKDRQTWKR